MRHTPILTYLLFINLVTVNAQEKPVDHSIMLKTGYGGTYTYKGHDLTGIKDNNRYSIDWIYKYRFGLSLSYDKPFLYDYFNLKELTVAVKYYPFQWYNQPFIGLNYTMGFYEYGDEKKYPYYPYGVGTHNAFGICWGLNIRFPKNIFIVFEANNIFSGYTGIIDATHTLYINGMLGYKLNLGKK